jgi:hypothetical protein
METTCPAGFKHAATGRKTKAKVPKKLISKEEKGV